jgi:hypothetical protein
MVDDKAPIVPGKPAAGISIGDLVREVIATAPKQSTTKRSGVETHDLARLRSGLTTSYNQMGPFPGSDN